MKRIYREYFHISKDDKVTDKVMLVRVALTALCVVACLFSMTVTAYAYFTYQVTSSANTIQAATYDTTVVVEEVNPEGNTPVELTKTGGHTCEVELAAGKEYRVQITPDGTGTTGFAIVKAESLNQTYHTQQLGKDVTAENQNTSLVSFTLKVHEDVKLTFISHWGTSSCYDAYSDKGENEDWYITDGETIELGTATETLQEQSDTEDTKATEAVAPSDDTGSGTDTASAGTDAEDTAATEADTISENAADGKEQGNGEKDQTDGETDVPETQPTDEENEDATQSENEQ